MQVLVSGKDLNCLYIVSEFLVGVSLTIAGIFYALSAVCILC
jgi:hypothetical protein